MGSLRCSECETITIGRARGWRAVLVDRAGDEAEPDGVVIYCPACARELLDGEAWYVV